MKLSFDKKNARKHDKKNKSAVYESIKELGAGRSIVADRDGAIIGGNATYEQAKALGLELEYVHTNGDKLVVVVRDDLSTDDPKRKALALADNRTAEMAEWDNAVLQDLVAELPEELIECIGFDDAFMESIGASAKVDEEPVNEDDLPELQEEAITEPGRLYQLGPHRLICGDSTDPKVVAALLAGEKPGMMVTDPPYGVEYDPSWRHERGINSSNRIGEVENDDCADWSAAWRLFPGDVAYVWHASLKIPEVAHSLTSSGFELKSQIIWNKLRLVMGRSHYHWQHEPAWYAVRKGATARFTEDRTQTTVWDIPMTTNHNQDMVTQHGTQKPVECMARPMRNHGFDLVYDPFLGSGTSIIAGTQVGKSVYGCELSPVYCDLIVMRYCNLKKIDADAVFKTGIAE